MRFTFYFSILLVFAVTSCESSIDDMSDSADYASTEKTLRLSSLINMDPKFDRESYLTSNEFAEAINSLYIYTRSENTVMDFVVDASARTLIAIPSTNPNPEPSFRTIRWFARNEPNVPDGIYLLDTCNGTLTNVLGQDVGCLAGLWGSSAGEDCTSEQEEACEP